MSFQKTKTANLNSSLPAHPLRKRSLGCINYGLLAVLIIPIILLMVGAAFQAVRSALDARRFPAPGRLVEVNGSRLHIHCTGSTTPGLPTVVLVASHPATSSSWIWIQPELSKVTRTCSYDRSGIGWSDPNPSTPTMGQMAEELHTLLEASGEAGPYILVGHSWGGGITRLYQAAYPEQVSGLVWIEATHPDAWKRRGVPESTFGGMNPQMVEGIPFVTRLGIFRIFPALRGGWGVVPELPVQQQEELVAYFNTNKWAEYVVAVEHVMPVTLAQLRQSGSMGNTPIAIVLGGDSEETDSVGSELQAELAKLSENSAVYHIDGANHSTLVHDQRYAHEVSQVILQMVSKITDR